jgi:hypothetical protein
VPARQNAEGLRAALARGGNPDVTITILPRLNHFFQIASPAAADAGRLDETVAPEILSRLGDWVEERAKPK